jgi:hypothetical protein
MQNTATWDQLDRAEQKALARLFGGGSLLRIDSELITPLAKRGLVNRNGLTPAGEEVCLAELAAFKRRVYGFARRI